MRQLKSAAVARWSAAICVCFAALQNPAAAMLKQGGSWTKASPDGRYLLVMLSKVATDPRAIPAERDIRDVFPQSGVYRNDDSHELLWAAGDHYYYPGTVYFSPDGQQVVIAGCEASTGPGNCRIAFLSAGREPRSVAFLKCVPHGRLKWRISGDFFEPDERQFDPGERRFDPDELTYTVRSEMGESFVFDVRTGTLRGISSPWHRCALGLLFCLAAIGAILAWLLVTRRRQAKPREEAR